MKIEGYENNIKFECADGVARIVLDRPDRGNAIDLAMARRLARLAICCDNDPSVRVVVLSGMGRLFCAGGDVESFAAAGADAPAYLSDLAGTLHSAVSRFARMQKPSVARVHGAAAGAGLPLAASCDIVIASDSASFCCAYTAIGLSADGASTWILPRLVGLRRAQDMLLTNRKVTAGEAEQIGLVTSVVADDALDAAVDACVSRLVAGPTHAFGRIKSLLADSFGTGLETQLELEARAIAQSASGAEAREGIAAFLQKRKPDFRSAT
ncbi:MAG: enoyl-CoA hydratase [Alphaproteobacteria bacterium RIFCSPHIGHO2_12_FULL_63_12]|nr:MAG: enoyl-CoA hydratase [Alphaproteobacteria bacterium RIFCSPHIGHO2_12_FULL_63_12]